MRLPGFQQEVRNILIPEYKRVYCLADHKVGNGLCANVLFNCLIEGRNQCFRYVASEG